MFICKSSILVEIIVLVFSLLLGRMNMTRDDNRNNNNTSNFIGENKHEKFWMMAHTCTSAEGLKHDVSFW